MEAVMKPAQTYDARKARRDAQRERALGGESLAAFHARETAPPPTLAEIFAKNRADKARCVRTPDLFAKLVRKPKRAQA